MQHSFIVNSFDHHRTGKKNDNKVVLNDNCQFKIHVQNGLTQWLQSKHKEKHKRHNYNIDERKNLRDRSVNGFNKHY